MMDDEATSLSTAKDATKVTLNAPIPPDITVTDRLQMVIAEWKGAQAGHPLARLYQDCLDLVGAEKQLLPLRIIPVRALDSTNLERALKRYHFPLQYAVDTVGRFEAALVPVLRESGSAAGFLFVYEEAMNTQNQVALFAHAIGHLILNDQERLKEHELPLDPDSGETHIDRLSELRYLDISQNRNYLDRQVLDGFPKLTQLIEPPEESQIALDIATRQLETMLRKLGWVNQFVSMRYRYTQGRVIPNSKQRGKREVVDALLRTEASLPTAVVHVQRSDQTLEEAVGRVRRAAQQLSVPFAYILTTQQEVIELHWLSGSLPEPQLRATLPNREELRTRWLTALQLTDTREGNILTYPYEPTQTPRYYQEAAINQAVIAALQARKGLRQRRILLTLATGTGKTQVAFQILWKMRQTYSVGNVLFLADRGYLLDQAQNNTFGPFVDAIVRGMGKIDTAHHILFGTYQWLTTLQDGVERYKGYPSDYFDVIIIDECHRGSADENSNWRRILEYFTEAIQIGLTATPLETKDVQTKNYFGDPVYTYTLSQGINDGYLAPYSVRRVLIEKVDPAATAQPVETLDQQMVMQTGQTMRQYTQTIAEHLARYLQLQADPRSHKTIVFCVDNEHADQMRMALEQTCATWARPGDITRIVDDDGPEGKRALNLFCTIRERQPVIVTTARLLTTGIDAPTCKTIVLARGVGSMVEFKQIIGRGTRLAEPQKSWFTIIDYAGAIKHFSDPAFDGDPTSVQCEYLIPPPPAPAVDSASEDASMEAAAPAFPATSTQQDVNGTNELPEQPAPLYQQDGSDVAPDGHSLMENDFAPAYEAKISPSDVLHQSDSHTERTEYTPPEQEAAPVEVCQSIIATGAVEEAAKPAVQSTQRATEKLPGQSPEKAQRADARPIQQVPEVTIEKANGNRYVIRGEFSYELDASGRQLRDGTNTTFTQEALKDLVKTPEDLHDYWTDRKKRDLLIEHLASEVVGLDALAAALHMQECDYYDLLLHVLFQQPALTRLERVQRLRAGHSTFFQRFEHNPLAKELLDAMLEKYIQGDAPDVSDVELLRVQPFSTRTRMEWAQAFSQGSPRTSINAVLKELQRLLYSV